MDRERRLIAAGARRGAIMMASLPEGPTSVLLPTPAGVRRMHPLDDGRVVVVGLDGRIHIVNVDGTGTRLLQGPADRNDALVSPDGRAVYSCDDRSGLWQLDLEGGPPHLLEKLPQTSEEMDFSPDGRTMVLPSPREIGLRDLATGQTRRRPIGPTGSTMGAGVIFARWAAGGVLFVGGQQSAVRWWDPATDEEVTFGVRAYLAPPMVTRDRSRAVWIDREGTVYILDVQSRLVRTLVGHQTVLRGSAMTPDGRWLAVTHGGAARLFALPPPPPWRQDLRLGGGGRRAGPAGREVIAVVGGQSLVGFDQRSGSRRPLADLGGRVQAFALSSQSMRAAVSDPEGRALVVDLASGKTSELVPARSPVSSLDFVGDHRLVGLEQTGEIHVWDLQSGSHRIAARLPPVVPGESLPGLGGYVFAAGRAPRVLVSNIRNALLLDLDTTGATPIDFGDTMNDRVISADGRLVVAGQFDGAVVLAEPRGEGMHTRLLTRRPGYVQEMAFTPDQRALIIADETGALARVDLATGATRELGRHLARIESIAISPSGRFIASSDITGEVRIWEPGAHALLAMPRTGVAMRLEFLGDDRLLSQGRDGWIQVSDIDPDQFVPATPAGLSRRLADLTTAHVDAAGEPISY
jgi:WD40 repeat protein